MTALAWIAGYFGVGLGFASLWMWLEIWDYHEYGGGIDPFVAGFNVVLWPVCVPAAIATVVLRRVKIAVLLRQERRLEAQREMRAAELEVERVLRGGR